MKTSRIYSAVIFVVGFFLSIGFMNCSRPTGSSNSSSAAGIPQDLAPSSTVIQGTSTGNGLVDVAFKSFSPTFNSSGPNGINNLRMCFKRLRFVAGSSGSDMELQLGEVDIQSTGTNLTSVQLQAGTYERVEFDLQKECAAGSSGNSISFTNDHGSFATNDRMTIKFEGLFVYDGNGHSLDLLLNAIVSNLNQVTNSSQIKDKAESSSGSF